MISTFFQHYFSIGEFTVFIHLIMFYIRCD